MTPSRKRFKRKEIVFVMIMSAVLTQVSCQAHEPGVYGSGWLAAEPGVSNSPPDASKRKAQPVKKGQGAAVYMPLSKTARWDFRARFALPLIRGRAKAKMYVDGVKKVNGKNYYRLVTEVNAGILYRKTVVTYHRHDGRGMYQLAKDERDEALLFPSPLVVGKKWKASISDGVLDGEVVAKEDVRTGDKVYKDCLKVVLTSGDMKRTQWLAPGIGVVKTSDRHGSLEVKSELVAHRK